MRRDLLMVCNLLEKMEEMHFRGLYYSESTIETDHIRLLIEEGFVKAKPKEVLGGNTKFVVEGLTWKGHDKLDELRSKGAGN